MSRYNSIFRGPAPKTDVQTVSAVTNDEFYPGTVVSLHNGELSNFPVGIGDQIPIYLLDSSASYAGGDTDTAIAAGQTGVGIRLQDDMVYAALVATGNNITAVDMPLTVNAVGVLVLADVGNDVVLFHSQEIYNNNTGTNQLVRVRKA